MSLSRLLGAAAKIITPIAETLGSLVGAPGRRVWIAGDRMHVEVRGVHQPGTERATEALRQRLLDLDGVRAVEINGHWGRAMVAHDPEVTDRDAILDVIAEIEREWELNRYGQPP